MSKRPYHRYGFTPEQFCEAWQSSGSGKEAALKLSAIIGKEVPPSVVFARATAYRSKGVKLKKMRSCDVVPG